MGNLLFSPTGRIGPSQFMSGATLLIVIGLVLGIIPILVPALQVIGVIGLVLLWCWIVLWVKRYHDAGKSGWMCLIPIIVWLVVAMIAGQIFSGMFADPVVTEAIEAATEAGDIGEIFRLSMGGGMTKTGQFVNVFAGAAISYVVAMIFNNMIKQDQHDNQFGPHPSTADTFS